ncbi:Crp/Fnr family transcriptional regulator [Lactobacillus delbrueckii subsp. indicus]|jgi:CRP-like cAMP-binding protein|uniref:Crp/Fnr family transcriptional regulator n=1 Tax=Lactobacillus delbrueckii TaxID=1584 RepID=UPI0022213C76|nr:Crp/Fnr family transcriptional regulator [Lactobacillus delbrueckii]UYX13196.1 Crp/Fnr family transcriptional regulator [Lactobacillus delbrueckii]UYY85009.1 Crp/Fnr family transcriptional regulator [Lactobacillus delbrueckii subsp. indicus]
MQHICVSLVPLFADLPEKDQLKINSLTSHRRYQKGETIFQPGDEKLQIVARGNMKVYQLSASGREQLLRVAQPGDYEGEAQLFGLENDSFFGQAMENTEICSLSKADFNRLLLENPQLSLKLLELSTQKLLATERQTQFLAMERVEERLASYLLDLAKAAGSDQVQLPMKMKDIAFYLGTTPETLSRKFKLLEKMGYLKRTGKQVKILDEDGLLDL